MKSSPGRRQRRTFGVVLLTLLWIGYAVVAILAALDVPGVPAAGMTRVFAELDLADEASLLLAAIAAITALGLLLHRSWGWVLAVITVGIGLAFDIFGWMNGREGYPYLAMGVAIAFYLNQGDVRRRFFVEDDPAPAVTLADGERAEQ